jgi:hypothetical protein
MLAWTGTRYPFFGGPERGGSTSASGCVGGQVPRFTTSKRAMGGTTAGCGRGPDPKRSQSRENTGDNDHCGLCASPMITNAHASTSVLVDLFSAI